MFYCANLQKRNEIDKKKSDYHTDNHSFYQKQYVILLVFALLDFLLLQKQPQPLEQPSSNDVYE